jgi:antitoxin (DNA-binding transcriptional repressor) of toxin-antitoxin stability system
MDFTSQQLQSIDAGEPVALTVEGRPCILLPTSLYDQLREAIDDWHPRTMRPTLARMMAEDWNDPSMAVYDQLVEHSRAK